jgi:hypothetical protein
MRIPIDYAAVQAEHDVRTPGPKQQSELTSNLDSGKKQGPQVGMTLEYDTELQMLVATKIGAGVREVVLVPRERIRHMEPSDVTWQALQPSPDLYPKPVKLAMEAKKATTPLKTVA